MKIYKSTSTTDIVYKDYTNTSWPSGYITDSSDPDSLINRIKKSNMNIKLNVPLIKYKANNIIKNKEKNTL